MSKRSIIVIDENNVKHKSTYLRRANGLVINGRARWVDEKTICLLCPPLIKTEDKPMIYNEEAFFIYFDRMLMDYEGFDGKRGDMSEVFYNDKKIAQHWGERGKSLSLWLKNILQQEKYKDEIFALPNSVKSKFKQRPRKPCPRGQCYKNDRDEKVFTYTYEDNQYEMCERRSFVFKGDDVELVPVFLRLLELEYGLTLRKMQ